jgi:hypothetical protein
MTSDGQVLELMGRQLAKAGHIDSETNVLVAALKRDETLPPAALPMTALNRDETLPPAALPMTARPAATTTRAQLQRMLRDVAAWLVINAMKSERVQFDQLCHQNLCNIWRQRAHEQLLAGHTLFRVPKEVAASYVHQALGEAFLSNREGAVGRAKLDGKALALYFCHSGDQSGDVLRALREVHEGRADRDFEVIAISSAERPKDGR